jgi:hypothetical protein
MSNAPKLAKNVKAPNWDKQHAEENECILLLSGKEREKY